MYQGLLFLTGHGAYATHQTAFVHADLVREVYCWLIVINDYGALRQLAFLSRMQLTARIATRMAKGNLCFLILFVTGCVVMVCLGYHGSSYVMEDLCSDQGFTSNGFCVPCAICCLDRILCLTGILRQFCCMAICIVYMSMTHTGGRECEKVNGVLSRFLRNKNAIDCVCVRQCV